MELLKFRTKITLPAEGIEPGSPNGTQKVDCILSLAAITVMIGLDYLMPEGLEETAKDASIIIPVIVFAIFVSVSRSK